MHADYSITHLAMPELACLAPENIPPSASPPPQQWHLADSFTSQLVFSPASCLALLLVDMAVGLAQSQLCCAWRCWHASTRTLSVPGVSVSTVQKSQLFFFFIY